MPNGAQISQLVLQVDAQVAVAQRSLQDLARTVQQSSAAANTALGTTDATITRSLSSHHQLGLAFNNARIAQTELTAAVTRSVDAYGAGASPLRILTTEMGRLTEAASFLGGGAGNGVMGKMLRFLGGPWGIALLLAGSVLAKVASAHKDAGDSVEALVDKMRKQASQAQVQSEANHIWANSLDGVREAQRKLREEIEKGIQTEHTKDLQDLTSARTALSGQQKALPDAQKRYAALGGDAALGQLQQQLSQGSVSTANGAGQGNAVLAADIDTLKKAKAAVDQLNSDIAASQETVRAAETKLGSYMGALAGDLGRTMQDQIAQNREAIQQFVSDTRETNTTAKQAIADHSQDVMGAISVYEKAVQKATSADNALADSVVKKTDKQFNDLTRQLLAGKEAPEAFAASLAKMAKQLDVVTEAAKNAKKGTGELGKQISFGAAEAIAKGAGLTVTSGQRSDAHQADLYNDPRYNHPGNPVARPVSMGGAGSAHEGLNGKWAIDIAFAPGMTAQSLKKLYGDQGVTLSAVYKESGHYHIEGSTSQATAAQKAADRAAQKQQTDDDQFAKESAQLDAETLAARRQLVAGFDSQADIAAEEVEAQRKAAQEAIQKQLDAKQINVDQAKILSIQADDRAAAQQAVIARRKLGDLLDQQAKALDQAYGFQLDDLKFTDEMARTQSEHRTLQLQILDIQYQQKEANLQHLLDTIKQNKDFAKSDALQNQAAGVQAELDRLPTDKAHGQGLVEKGTLDPLQAWADKVPKTAAEINEALQSIEVEGIDSLASGIGEVINGTKSLGQVFKDISSQIIGDIIQMTVKMLIFRALSSVFGGSGAQPVGINLGNTSLVPAGGAPDLTSLFPPRASGGPVTAGQPYIVGEKQAELFVPSSNGMILPSIPRISIPAAANDRGDVYNVYQTIAPNFAGNAATQEDVLRMGLIAKQSTLDALRQQRRRRA